MKKLLLMLLCMGVFFEFSLAQSVAPKGLAPDGTVFSLKRKGNILYVGGGFNNVGFHAGGTAYFSDSSRLPDADRAYVFGDVLVSVPDGQGGWFIGGDITQVNSTAVSNIAHILPNQTVDPNFLPDVDGTVYAIAVWNDTMMFGGDFLQIDGISRQRIASWDLTQQQLTSWDPQANGRVTNLIYHKGKVYAGGNFSRIGQFDQPSLAKIDPQTGEPEMFPGPVSGIVNDFEIENDILYTVGGYSGASGYYANRIAEVSLNQDVPVYNFPKVDGIVDHIIPDGNGGWFIGGRFFDIGAIRQPRLAHILPNNEVDTTFKPVVNSNVYALSLFNDTLFFGGTFRLVDGQTRERIAAYDFGNKVLLPWNPGANNQVSSILATDQYVYAGGSFTYLDSAFTPGFAVVDRLNGTYVQTPTPISGAVNSIARSGNDIYAGGSFNTAVGYPAGRAARLTWEDSLPPLPFAEFNGTVETIIPDGQGGWYVGGSFLQVNGQRQIRLAHILPNLTIDPTFNLEPNNTVTKLQIFNDTMMIAGQFTTINSQTRNRIAAYNLSSGSLTSFNPDLNNRVNDLAIFNDTIMIVGNFTTVGGQTRERVAMLNRQTGALLPFSMTVNSTAYSIAFNDTMMYVGGQFFTVNGQTRQRLMGIRRGTGALSSFSPTINNIVRKVDIAGDQLYLGGNFTTIETQTRSRLASFNLGTQALTNWNPDANNQVTTFRIFNDTMMLGGTFTQIAGQPIQRLAKIDINTGIPYSFRPNPDNGVNTILWSGGEAIVGGGFRAMRAKDRSRLFKLDPSDFTLDSFAPDINGTIEEIIFPSGPRWNDTMMIAGSFTQVNGQAKTRLATMHKSTGQEGPLSVDIDNTVFSISIFNDTMMLGGRFGSINSQPQAHLAAVNPSTGAILPWQPEPNNRVFTIAHGGGRTIAGGEFQVFQGKTRNRTMAINLFNDTIMAWHPSITGLFFPKANALSIADSVIYIAGSFGSIGGTSVSNLAAVDKITGTPNGQSIPIDDQVYDVDTKGDSLIIVGRFGAVDGIIRRNAACINRQNFQLVNWQLDPDRDGRVVEIEGNNIFLGGEFSLTNSLPRKNGCAINIVTQEITPWNPNPNNIITDIEVSESGDKVYVAGGFSTIAGDPVAYFAALDPNTGSNIPGWDLDIPSTVRAIEVNPRNGAVYIGGRFTSVAGSPRNRIAAIDPTGNLLPFQVDLNDDVRSMAFRDTMMYISGSFTQVDGQARNKIAAVTASGQLMDWEPTHNSFSFNDMGDVVASPEKIFLQGSFSQINGTSRPRIAAVGPRKAVLDKWNPRLARGAGSFSVNEVFPIGNDVFVAGTFTSANNTPVSGLARLNIRTGVIQPPIVKLGRVNSIFAFEAFDDRLFIAGDYDSVDNSYQPNLASLRFNPGRFSRRANTIKPTQGGNTGDVTVRIFGYGFQNGARVIFRKSGFPDIVSLDSANVVTGGRSIEASFILRGEPVGKRDVIIEIPGDTTYIIPDGFEIVQGEEPNVWVDMVGPKLIRRRASTRFIVNYGNRSNIDAVGVPVWILLPKSFAVDAFSVKIARPRDSTQAFYDQIPRFFPIDSIGNRPFSGNLYVFTIPKIPANSSDYLTIRFKAQTGGNFRYKVWVTKPMFGSPLKRLAGECIDEILVDLFGLVPGAGCALGVMEATLCPMLDYADPESGFGSGDYLIDWGAGLAETVVTCALDASLVGGVVADIIKLMLAAKNNQEIGEKCLDQYGEEDDDEGGGTVITSFDPNNKIGLPGEASQGWINTDQVFSYLINFENVDTATAAALTVTIYDTLDTQVFDMSSVQLGFFTIADSLYAIPKGLQDYEVVVDLRPRLPFYTKLEAHVNQQNGAMEWKFTTLDVQSLLPSNDPLLGFLPPNSDSISGTGSVFYTVSPKANLSTGTSLDNKADIVFDTNAPIITDPWINTADNDNPVSQVLNLPDTMTTTLIPLRWRGSDVGSGIRYYNIFYSKNGDQYLTAAYHVSDTAMIFEADPGASYRFYSIAYDTARNREPIPLVADAETYVPLSVNLDPVLSHFIARIYPNPNKGKFQVEIKSPKNELVEIQVSNLMGQIVHKQSWQVDKGQSTLLISLNVAPGIYNVTLRNRTGNIYQKLEIQ